MRSDPTPQPNQAQRSSADSSIGGLPPGMRRLRWQVVGDNAGSVRFDVLQNVRFDLDRSVFSDLHSGAETPYNPTDPLYIANPRGAEGQPFQVQISACP